MNIDILYAYKKIHAFFDVVSWKQRHLLWKLIRWRTYAQVERPDLPPTKLAGHDSEVTCVAWCPTNNDQLISGSDDNTIRIWDSKPLPQPVPASDLKADLLFPPRLSVSSRQQCDGGDFFNTLRCTQQQGPLVSNPATELSVRPPKLETIHKHASLVNPPRSSASVFKSI